MGDFRQGFFYYNCAMSNQLRLSYVLPTLLIIAALTLVGCGGVSGGNLPRENRESEVGNTSDRSSFNTATPPAQPDLRGTTFRVILFVSEVERYSHVINSIQQSVSDGAEYFNSQGGVNGATVEVETVSLASELDLMTGQVLTNLVKHDPVIGLLAAPMNDALYYELNQQEVPILTFGLGENNSSEHDFESDKVFWLVPFPEIQLETFFLLAWDNWEEIRPAGTYNEIKIGYLGEEGGSLQEIIDHSLLKLEQAGFDIRVRGSVVSSANGSATNFLLNSVQSRVTAIYSNTSSSGTSVLLNDLGSLALENAFLVGGSIWSIDSGIEGMLLKKESLKGYLQALPVRWWTEIDNPAIRLATEIFNEFADPGAEPDLAYLVGLAGMDVSVKVLQSLVIDEESGDLTADDVFAQMVKMHDYPVLGGLYHLDYTDGNRAPIEMWLWRYQDDTLFRVGK